MRWKKKSQGSMILLISPFMHSRIIIEKAYEEGYINWNTFKKALEKINSNMNGSWMFEQKETQLNEAKQLCSGVFWILSDSYDLSDHKLLIFGIPCDHDGNPLNTHSIELNSKSGNSYNHKKLWESEVKNNSEYSPYNKKDYNYYPRGRVEISHNRAIIYLNPNINKSNYIDEIKEKFGLSSSNIPEVRVKVDGSIHYQCFLDWN